MSPYPAQVTRDGIIDRARDIIEAEGLERLTLQHLASALGIQAPSLYRHVGNKSELLRAVNEITVHRLITTVLAVADPGLSPHDRVTRMAWAYREFAHKYPATYNLAFTATRPEIRPDPQELEALVLPVQAVLAEVSGEANSLAALRGLLSLMHGFITLELAGQFRRGGDLTTDFKSAVEVFVQGWARRNA